MLSYLGILGLWYHGRCIGYDDSLGFTEASGTEPKENQCLALELDGRAAVCITVGAGSIPDKASTT